MSKELPFIIFCIEEYKTRNHMDGASVVNLFEKYGVFDYIKRFYESLHTMSPAGIMDDIEYYISDLQSV